MLSGSHEESHFSIHIKPEEVLFIREGSIDMHLKNLFGAWKNRSKDDAGKLFRCWTRGQ